MVRVLAVACRRIAVFFDRQSRRFESMHCTGVSASWCPVCGDCVCPPYCHECGGTELCRPDHLARPNDWFCKDCELWVKDDGTRLERNSDECPLHAAWSTHAEADLQERGIL